jgi:uncharacterized protein (DUF2336 family)
MSIEQADIQRLVQEPSPAVRSTIAAKLSGDFNTNSFTSRENQLAIDIFRLLLRDTAVQVRASIAENLKANPNVPHDIIMKLASDVSDVAVHVLEHSMVLTDEDLQELIAASADVEKWMAIGRREELSAQLCTTLLETRNHKVVTTVVENKTAKVCARDMDVVLSEYRGNQTIMEALVCRGGLSPQFAERVYAVVADKMKRQITRKHMLAWNLTKDAADVARDVAIIRFIIPHVKQEELFELVGQMHRNKRLSYGIMLRSLCHGELRFFEMAMAHVAKMPVTNARSLLLDAGTLGYNAIYNSSVMPSGFAEAMRVIYRTAYVLTEKGTQRIANFAGHMIDLIYANGYHESVENISYFISILKQQHYGNRVLH